MSWPAISHLEFLECFFSNLLTLIYVRVRLKIQPNLVHLHCLFGGAPTLIFLFNPLWSHYASATLALPHRLWNFSHEYIFHCVHVEFFLGGCSSFHHFLRLHTYIVYMDSGISEYLKPMFKGLKSAMGLGLFFKDILALFLVHYWMTFQCETAKPKSYRHENEKKALFNLPCIKPIIWLIPGS